MKPPTESKLVTAVCTYLQLLENQGKLVFWRVNSGTTIRTYIIRRGRHKGEERRYFYQYGKEGSSDVVVFLPHGRVLFLECKRDERGKLRDSQERFRAMVARLGWSGYEYHRITDVEQVENLVKGE